jgi:predicted RNA-binding Zn ribbon-like protein
VQFNHDNMTGPVLAADLATLAGRNWTRAGVENLLAMHAIRRRELSDVSCERLLSWAIELRDVFTARSTAGRIDVINRLLKAGTSNAYLTMHDELRPHLHFAAEHDDLVARVQAVTAGGLAIFAVEAEGSRLGACRRAGCPAVFVDTSRNGRRAYCSTTCGNYDAVRRHRGARSL